MLDLTPAERLLVIENLADSIAEIRALNDRARYAEVLRRLAANDVEFIVVGMMAGVLRGAPFTADLDLVHRRSADNVSRLLDVLAGLDAIYRHDPPSCDQRSRT